MPNRRILILIEELQLTFLKFDLGNLTTGKIAEATLTSSANVRLMTSANFNNYKNGRNYQSISCLPKRSPVRLEVPNSGHWYVAIDMQGLRGSTKASVKVLP